MTDRTCSEDGCDRPVDARGLCNTDYARYRRSGKQLPPTRSEARVAVKCGVDDCPRAARIKGYCNRHYKNFHRTGNPVPLHERPLEVRLREVGWMVTESGCWEWKGHRDDAGYGTFQASRLGFESTRAHRVMYEHFVGPIPDGLLVRHTCDNPPCVNPDHLIPGTALDNALDMIERGRHWTQNRTHCTNGHDLRLPGATRRVRVKRGNQNRCRECDRECKRRIRQRQRDVASNGGAG